MHSFRYANKLLSTKIMRELYYSHIYPHLILQISIWGTNNSNKTYIQPLIRTQKKILRLIKNLPPRSHTKPIMKELHILNIINLYTHRVCVEMHPFIHPKKQTRTQSQIHSSPRNPQSRHQILNPATPIHSTQHGTLHKTIHSNVERSTNATPQHNIHKHLQKATQTTPPHITKYITSSLNQHQQSINPLSITRRLLLSQGRVCRVLFFFEKQCSEREKAMMYKRY